MGRVPPPAVYHDPKKKGMIIADVAKRPQNWDKPMIFKKQQHTAGTTPPKPSYYQNKSGASTSAGKKTNEPSIKELSIRLSSLTNQVKQLKESAHKGLGQKSPARKTAGDQTQTANDFFSGKKSSLIKRDKGVIVDTGSTKSSSSSNKLMSTSSKTSTDESTNVWIPKRN